MGELKVRRLWLVWCLATTWWRSLFGRWWEMVLIWFEIIFQIIKSVRVGGCNCTAEAQPAASNSSISIRGSWLRIAPKQWSRGNILCIWKLSIGISAAVLTFPLMLYTHRDSAWGLTAYGAMLALLFIYISCAYLWFITLDLFGSSSPCWLFGLCFLSVFHLLFFWLLGRAHEQHSCHWCHTNTEWQLKSQPSAGNPQKPLGRSTVHVRT